PSAAPVSGTGARLSGRNVAEIPNDAPATITISEPGHLFEQRQLQRCYSPSGDIDPQEIRHRRTRSGLLGWRQLRERVAAVRHSYLSSDIQSAMVSRDQRRYSATNGGMRMAH